MFISKMSLPRRLFLRGMGAAVALPFLEAMVPAFTALAQSPAAPRRRFGAVFFPNGAIVEAWNPRAAGLNFEFSPILKPLEAFRDSLVVVSNLTRAGTTAGDHAVSAAGWLTGVYAKRTEAEDVRAGTTIDQVVASRIGQDTVFPSLEVATEDFTSYVGACTVGFSCVYANTISWSSPTTPLPMEINPRVVFERMFGEPGTARQREQRQKRDLSILDLITQDAADLRVRLGTGDRKRLGDYLDNIREIERRIQRAEQHAASDVVAPTAPIGVPESLEEHIGLMFDLLAVAYHAQLFARFLQKLRSTPDGDGSLLDHSLIVYGGGMGNPNQHATGPLPMAIVGGGAGKGNRHLQLPPQTPVGNLWLTVANRFGDEMAHFGESSGTIDLF
jgi:hypothetical protein